jgi:phosphodiesterase/alkaline phosphatase D-like protein
MNRRQFNKVLIGAAGLAASVAAGNAAAIDPCEVEKFAYRVAYKRQYSGYSVWIRLKQRGAFNHNVPFSVEFFTDPGMGNRIKQTHHVSAPENSHVTRIRVPYGRTLPKGTPLYARLTMGSGRVPGKLIDLTRVRKSQTGSLPFTSPLLA